MAPRSALLFALALTAAEARLGDDKSAVNTSSAASEQDPAPLDASRENATAEEEDDVSAQGGGNSRLRIRNGCGQEPIWIAHCCNYNYRQNVKIEPGAYHDFPVRAGLRGMRFWPKMRCDRHGNQCLVGQSGGPGQPCGSGGDWRCMPHIDTKFEVTFGSRNDYWDLSAVDGFTLPAKVTLSGSSCKVPGAPGSGKVLDCSRLTMSACPTAERLGGRREDLRLRWADSVAGCYSPCTKAQSLGHWASSPFARPYCCPNPPVSRQMCFDGGIERTRFVQSVRGRCERIYTHSYDDSFGNLNCPRGTTYEVTFLCLEGAAGGAPEGRRRRRRRRGP